MLELFDFQRKAAAQITERFTVYLTKRPGRIVGTKVTFVPYYQALASITASGKTVVMAQTIAELMPLLPVRPIVLWLSKGRVVVDQTFANLCGKYRHLLDNYEDVQLLSDFCRDDVRAESYALVYLATAGTFNRKSKDQSNLRLFKSDIDNADYSVWDALKSRMVSSGERRPLIIVYDEAHNLTDQQTSLLMELEPDVLLLATATPRLPEAITRVTNDLKNDLDWTDADLTTYIDSADVVEAGLVKRQILLGGYQAQMPETIDDLLADMFEANKAVRDLGLSILPKAAYVCRTNIVEGNSLQQDNIKRPFSQREAPPILIWNYLVNQKKIDPATVAVYTSALRFDKDFPPPSGFIHFKGGDGDYTKFIAGNFRHIIFNLGLQEGWDDPECYFAYIDKSMQSNIQVEQIIGRVLRQPAALHLGAEVLNTAHLYVRVDVKGVFGDIAREVSKRLGGDLPEVQIMAYDSGKRSRPTPVSPSEPLEVPSVYLDPTAALEPIEDIIKALLDFRSDTSDNVRGIGAKALVQQHIGSSELADIEWVERDRGNAISARWVFQTTVRAQFPPALEITRSDDPKLDARIELGSSADKHIRKAAGESVQKYLEYVVLKQRPHNAYVVGEVMLDPSHADAFDNALHGSYSGLNKTLELPFARELDKAKIKWCRNPSQSGFSIPLPSLGPSKRFFPDFLAWKGKNVFALDTKGEHILAGELGRKLLAVTAQKTSMTTLLVRLISPGQWNHLVQHISSEGFTVWALGNATELRPIYCGTMNEAVKICLRPTL